ncbi:MAG: HAD family phosphatase [Planctomycetales bacterium]|nr:HAD family phosphatase [Planctomycetales bacterium]
MSLPRTQTPRFIYFDLGNVLLNFDHEIACRQMAAIAGVEPRVIRELVFQSDLQWQYECGQVTSREFYDHFREQTRSEPEFAELLHAASDIFTLNLSIVPLVAHLKAAGHRLGILSNTCDAHWQFVTAGRYWTVPDAFSVHALSFELGAMKPDPKIYEAAAELAGCEPGEIFFMDDREDNVQGALAAGFDAVLFRDTPTLARDLRKRGVICNF